MRLVRPHRGTAWIRDSAALLFLGALTLFFFWRLFTPNPDDRLAIPRGDFTDQYYPLRHFVATTLANGELPFWNPHIFGGQPGLADPQAATFYPPALLNALLWGADFPLIALEIEVAAHLGWAMVGAYFFLHRGLGLRIVSALFGSIAWGFGGYLTGFPLQQVTILETVAWLPWLLLAVRSTICGVSRRRRRLSAALGALVTACAVLAGHPQSLLYLLYLATGYGLFLMWSLRGEERRTWLTRGGLAALMIILGIGAAAIQLLPTLAFIEESTRETLSYDFTRSGLVWTELLEVILPKVLGATPQYVGISTLLVAGIGIVAPANRGEKRFWAVIAVVGMAAALGGNSILYDLLYIGAPGFDSIRSQERVLVWWVWSVSLLGAWGVEALLGWADTDGGRAVMRHYGRILFQLVLFALLPLLAMWWLRALQFAQFTVNLEVLLAFFNRYVFFFVMLLSGWGIVLAGTRIRTPHYGGGAALLLALLIFDLFSITRAPHLGDNYEGTLPRVNEVVSALNAASNVGRVGIVGQPVPGGNDGMRWGFDLLSGNEPLRLESSKNFFENSTALRQFQLLHVTHVVADVNLAEGNPALYEHVAASSQGAASHLHRVRPVFPYAWVVGEIEQVEGRTALYRSLSAEEFDPYRSAVIDKTLTPLARDGSAAAEGATVTIEASRPGYAQIRVSHDASGPLLLLISEPNAAGWVSRLDGQAVRRERVNALNIGVMVPAGEHLVTLEFKQPRWQEGVTITVLSLLAITALALLALRVRKE